MMLWMLWLLAAFSVAEDAQDTDCNSTGEGVKLVKTISSSQSSHYKDVIPFTSDRALDGNQIQCAHTMNWKGSWWRADLNGVYNISCINVFNVQSDNTDITGIQIHIGNSREKNGTTNTKYMTISNFKIKKNNSFHFNGNTLGRYVIFVTEKPKFVVLCEVMIWGSLQESPFILITENKTWEDALYYCRDKHEDLASILDEQDQAWAELAAKDANSSHVWLGLHYTWTLGFWFWVEDHNLKYKHWASNGREESECDKSAAMSKHEDNHWYEQCDNEHFNFLCRKKRN